MIGRNDACHCGSGRKYKKCCLALDERAGPEMQRAFDRVALAVASGERVSTRYTDTLLELIRRGALSDLRFDQRLFDTRVSSALSEMEEAPNPSRDALYQRVRRDLSTPPFLREAERRLRAVAARGELPAADREALVFGLLLVEAARATTDDRDVLATLVFDAQIEEFFARTRARGVIRTLAEDLRAGRIDYDELRHRAQDDPDLQRLVETPEAQADMERTTKVAYREAVAALRSDSPPEIFTGPEAVYLWCVALPALQRVLDVDNLAEHQRRALLEELIETVAAALSAEFVDRVSDRMTLRALEAMERAPEAAALGAVAVAFGRHSSTLSIVALFAGLPAQCPTEEERNEVSALFSATLEAADLDEYSVMLARREDHDGLALLAASRVALEAQRQRATG